MKFHKCHHSDERSHKAEKSCACSCCDKEIINSSNETTHAGEKQNTPNLNDIEAFKEKHDPSQRNLDENSNLNGEKNVQFYSDTETTKEAANNSIEDDTEQKVNKDKRIKFYWGKKNTNSNNETSISEIHDIPNLNDKEESREKTTLLREILVN